MKPSEIRQLIHLGTPDPPYGVRALARCYDIEDLARLARRRLPAGAAGYLDGGGEGEWTLRRNRHAFDALEFLPRLMHDVSAIDTTTTLLGSPVPLPFALSPVGGPRMFQHEGELAVARAAAKAGIPYGVSTLATQPLEDIAEAGRGTPLWFQLYVWGDRSAARELLSRAKAAGYRALLLSADTSVRSARERELHQGVKLPVPELTIRTLLDGALHPEWSWNFVTKPAIGFPNLSMSGPTSRGKLAEMFDGTVSWDDLEWIRSEWDGPVVVKGVLRPADAVRAADHGASAVIVSNHGGRQLDRVPAALEALPGVVDAVGDRVEVLCDSGIRRGSDIAAALALGARGVLIGRPHLYGLAAAGEPGVRHAIDLLAEELRSAMGLCGAASLADLDRDLLRAAVPARAPVPAQALSPDEARPARPARSARPAGRARSSGSGGSGDPGDSSGRGGPSGPGDSAGPGDPAGRARSSGSGGPGDPSGRGGPGGPGGPGDPSGRGGPDDPGDPGDTSGPSGLAGPAGPARSARSEGDEARPARSSRPSSRPSRSEKVPASTSRSKSASGPKPPPASRATGAPRTDRTGD
jgi:L-lactate dehydrogenase (cytochrome)